MATNSIDVVALNPWAKSGPLGRGQGLPAVDFSRDISAHQPHRLLVLLDQTSGWVDLGGPGCVLATLARNGIKPEWGAEQDGLTFKIKERSEYGYDSRDGNHSEGRVIDHENVVERELIGDSPKFRAVLDQVNLVAPADRAVGRTMLAPCVTEWPTNEREGLAPAIVYPTKTKLTGF
jgi:hypothetical protein